MSTKTLQTRVSLKYDTYANWTANDPVLLQGEVAIVVVPAQAGAVVQEPAILTKVGDGTHKFSELSFTSAKAADVYDWAKASVKPEYAASEIGGLADFINNTVVDTNTTYKIEADASDATKFYLKAKEKGASEWTNISEFVIPVYTLEEGTTNGSVKFNGTNIAVHGLGSAAFTEASAYDVAGAASDVQGDTTSTVADAMQAAADASAAAATADGKAAAAQQTADAKVASVAKGDNSVTIGGTATAPTVAVAVSADENNALTLADDGLKVVVPEVVHPEYSIVKAEDSGDYASVYNLTKDGAIVGASINIPKDLFVKEGSVVENPEGQPKGTYIKLVLQNQDEPLYINVGDLIEYVTSGSVEGDMVFVTVSDDHKVSATITDGTVTLAKLHADVQAEINKAHTHSNKTVIDGITAEKVSAWDSAEQNAKDYADGLAVNYDEAGAAEAVLGKSGDTAGAATVYGAKAAAAAAQAKADTADGKADANATAIEGLDGRIEALEGTAEALADIASTGNVNDLIQTTGDLLILNCGSSSVNV